MLATGEPSLDNSIRPKIKITESQMKENLPIYEESKVNVNISERPK